MKPLLEVERLVVEAGGATPVRILDGIDLRIAPGEVVAAIGASGSGKSTLGLALAGYARPGTRIASGRIRFDDRDVLALPARELRLLRGRDIAFVPQSAAAAFNPALTIGAQVVEAAVLRGEASRAEGSRLAHRLFAGFGLPDPQSIGRRYPHQVSGGQLQRAAAAMAFAGNPKLIVFDEPTTSLDVTTQVGVLAAFRERIRSSKTAALYISHDIAVAAELADRIVVLEHGRIVDQGDARELVSRYGARRRGRALTRVLPDAEPLLAVDRLTVGYGRSATPALSEVSFDIRHGETVGVIGESGSGKSTLARALIGLLQSRNGAIGFAGQPLPALVRHRSLRTRKALQIAFQSADVALNPRQRAGDILGRPLTMFRGLRGAERDREVSRLLALFELPADVAMRFPSQLSGGQKQRINLARALAGEPDLVICDEVTSALDGDLRLAVIDLLRRLRDERALSLLFITHDLSCAAELADRIVVLHRGRVVETGPTAELLERPVHPHTAELVRSVPRPEAGWLDRALAQRPATKPVAPVL